MLQHRPQLQTASGSRWAPRAVRAEQNLLSKIYNRGIIGYPPTAVVDTLMDNCLRRRVFIVFPVILPDKHLLVSVQ
jgi:hypothetical protein